MNCNSYKDKVVLVTGGSRGIGRAICVAYSKAGASVIINYAGNEAAAKETLALCEAAAREYFADNEEDVPKVRALIIKADVSSSSEVSAMVKQGIEAFGRIDILVNNAGITKDNLMLRMSEQDFEDVLDINLKGTFLCMKEVSRLMIKQKSGRIVNVSSISGIAGNAGQANYAASKAGIIGLTKTMAKELASRGITVNAIAPGFIETDMTKCLSQELTDKIMEAIPLKRLGKPEDVANAVMFFTDENTDYVTGQVLQVDGGLA